MILGSPQNRVVKMNYNYILFLIIIGISAFFVNLTGQDKQKKELLKTRIVLILAVLICSLKAYSVGNDTQSYVNLFYRFGSAPFLDIIWSESRYEIGFQIFTWIIYHIVQSPTVYFLIAYTIVFVCVYYWVKENSDEPFLSAISIIFLFLPFLLTGFRQGIAMGFTLLSYNHFKKKQWIRFGLTVLAGVLFHMTSIVSIVFFASFLIRQKWIRRAVVIVSFFLTYTYRVALFDVMNSVISIYEKFQIIDGAFPVLYFLMLLAIYIGAEFLAVRSESDSSDNGLNYELNMFSFSLMLVPFVELNGNMMRMVMYASMYAALLIPRICSAIDRKINPPISRYIVMIVLMFIFLRMVLFSESYAYLFIWEG